MVGVRDKPTISLADCADATLLDSVLTHAGSTVVPPRSAGTQGRHDPNHVRQAAQHGDTILTAHPADCIALHQQGQAPGQDHAGILLVYYDNIGTQDLKPHDIVRALGNLVTSGLSIANEVHNLNHWQL